MTTKTVARVLTVDPVSIRKARSKVQEETGYAPDPATIYRWCLRGVGGVKLEHVRIGKRILTSAAAITRFIEARSTN